MEVVLRLPWSLVPLPRIDRRGTVIGTVNISPPLRRHTDNEDLEIPMRCADLSRDIHLLGRGAGRCVSGCAKTDQCHDQLKAEGKNETMSRYRKIDTRMWGDVRFRELSSPSPSGKYLWMFLLTGPQTSNIPGLFRAGE